MLYESDWIIKEHTVVRPNVMIICDVPTSDFVRVPPVLILEIFSASTRLKDCSLKFKLYEKNGVRYYLTADPEQNKMETFVLRNNRFEEINTSLFQLTDNCTLILNVKQVW